MHPIFLHKDGWNSHFFNCFHKSTLKFLFTICRDFLSHTKLYVVVELDPNDPLKVRLQCFTITITMNFWLLAYLFIIKDLK